MEKYHSPWTTIRGWCVNRRKAKSHRRHPGSLGILPPGANRLLSSSAHAQSWRWLCLSHCCDKLPLRMEHACYLHYAYIAEHHSSSVKLQVVFMLSNLGGSFGVHFSLTLRVWVVWPTKRNPNFLLHMGSTFLGYMLELTMQVTFLLEEKMQTLLQIVYFLTVVRGFFITHHKIPFSYFIYKTQPLRKIILGFWDSG